MDHTERYNLLKHVHKFDQWILNTVMFLSIAYIFVMVFELYAEPYTNSIGLIIIIDTIFCIIYLAEFFYFMFKAVDKKQYFKTYMLDFLSSLPFMLLVLVFPQLGFLNLFKMIRGLKSILRIIEYLGKKKFSQGLSVAIIFILILVYFAVIVVQFEKQTNPKLASFQDGIWWAVSTITTVGYGDVVPVTAGGKIAAMLLMIFGIGLTSVVGAIIVSILLKPIQKKMIEEEEKTLAMEQKLEHKEDAIAKEENQTLDMEKKLELNQEKMIEFEKDISQKLEHIESKLGHKKKSK